MYKSSNDITMSDTLAGGLKEKNKTDEDIGWYIIKQGSNWLDNFQILL